MSLSLSANFTLDELTASRTAAALGVDNTPSAEHIAHLQELVTVILQPMRDAWGGGIRVSSGYRGFRLNKSVGGSSSSAHCVGYAADLVPCNGKIKTFKAFVRKWLKEKRIPFDQFIDEKNNGSEWVHIGIRNRSGKQRRQYLTKR